MFDQGTTEITLTARIDGSNTGETGLVFDRGNFVFFSGSLAAHDLIEHVNGVENIGSVIDELQATGASYFTRVENGYNVTPEGLVNDLVSTAIEYVNGAEFGDLLPEQPESDNDVSFEWIIEEFQRKILGNLDDDDMAVFDTDTYCYQALQAMRLGEAKQEARFNTPWRALEMFQAVEGAINKHFGVETDYKYGANMTFDCYEGQEFKLTITQDDEHGLRVDFDEYYEDDEGLCPECRNCVLEDGECADCDED